MAPTLVTNIENCEIFMNTIFIVFVKFFKKIIFIKFFKNNFYKIFQKNNFYKFNFMIFNINIITILFVYHIYIYCDS